MVIFGVSSAYAAGPDMIDPGGGGDGDPPNEIRGGVYFRYYNPPGDPPVPGVSVRLYMVQGTLLTYTDGDGGFKFDSPYIVPNMSYLITINGNQTSLGVTADDPQWGQWAGYVYTDDYGYGVRTMEISPSTVVNVPAAALFSNTKYVTLSYEMTGTHYVSHSMSFSLEAPVGVNLGYATSKNFETGSIFETAPLTRSKIVHRYYAVTYSSDGYMNHWGIVSTGIAGAEQSWDWDFLATSEYLQAGNLPNYKETRVDTNRSVTKYFTETNSYTWSLGNPLAIQYSAFGVTINLDVTVASTSSNTVKYKIDREGDSNPNTLAFWAYTQGAALYFPETGNGTGGMELHVWDASGAG